MTMTRGIEVAPVDLTLEQVFRTLAHSFEAPPEIKRALRARWVPYFGGCQQVLDIACGEGILLELLREAGIPARGIDIDPVMVGKAQAKELDVIQARAEDHLHELRGCYDGVFLGHIVEHLPGRDFVQLLYEARQAMTPGGVMIILTPNFANPGMALSNFWLDVTHQRPYPRSLLEKLMAILGFEIVESGTHLGDAETYVVGRLPGQTERPDSDAIPAPRRSTTTRVGSPAVAAHAPPSGAEQLAIAWEGPQFSHHSFATVNREICLELLHSGHELAFSTSCLTEFEPGVDPRFAALAECFTRPLSRPAEVTVRHAWPPDFTPPREGHWVMIEPWAFGSLPRRWVEAMANDVDEFWVYSSQLWTTYVRSGLPAERVHIVPLGVDPTRFRPDTPPTKIGALNPYHNCFKFLFVGGTIWRKGIDILLRAYHEAFTADDDVCLVIKDLGKETVYQGQTHELQIHGFRGAPVVYLSEDWPPDQIPGLYTACDALVHPYRAEGFGLPMAEAMACGLPAIVTGRGAALDFCSPEVAFLIPASEQRFVRNDGPEWETVHPMSTAEPDAHALAGIMREVYRDPAAARAVGLRASAEIRSRWTWAVAATEVERRARILREQPIRRPIPC